MSLQWYVACAHQGQERLAKQQLEAQEFEVYLPMCISGFYNSRMLPRIKPFLAPYFFIRIDLDDRNKRWNAVYSTRGIRSVIGGARPQAISRWIVDEIKSREVEGYVQLPPSLQCRFAKGDAVKVKGLDAVFHEVVDKTRAEVFLKLLGKTNKLIVPLSKLTAAAAATA